MGDIDNWKSWACVASQPHGHWRWHHNLIVCLPRRQWYAGMPVKYVGVPVDTSSSRMRVINHNWSVVSHKTASLSAECSRDKLPFSFVRGQDSTMWDIVWVSPQRHKISVCKSPFPSAGTAVSLVRAKTVQQRPLLPREVEAWLPTCAVTH